MGEPSASAAAAADPPLDDAVYRAVVAARDEEALTRTVDAEWRRAGTVADGLRARVVLTHYRPRSRARLIARVEIPRPGKKKPRVQELFIQVYPTLAAARRRFAHVLKTPLKCVGPAVFLIEPWAAVAWALPNGPMLRASKMLMRRRKFGRFLVEAGYEAPEGRGPRPPKLLRYVPRHRALFRHAEPDPRRPGAVYVKLYSPGHDEAAAAHLALARAAAEASGAFEVPELVAHVTRRRALVMREVPGRRLTDVVGTPQADAAFRAVGRALAALHASGMRPAESWSAGAEVAALRTAMADVARALPALRPRLRELVDEIDRRGGSLSFDAAPIHANMFADQVLVDDALRVGIVDWDDAAMGDPLYDVGRLVAHVLFLQQRDPDAALGGTPVPDLLSGYENAGGLLDPDRLRWHVASALLLRAKISALRPLPDGWIADIERSLSTTQSLLAGGVLQQGPA